MSVLSDFFSNIYNYIMTFFSTNETHMETDTCEANTCESKDNIELEFDYEDDNYTFNDTQKLISLTPTYLWRASDV
jgi:hypothetical protein